MHTLACLGLSVLTPYSTPFTPFQRCLCVTPNCLPAYLPACLADDSAYLSETELV